MSLEVGNLVSGKVTGIKNFGAFVDLGNNQSGLIHISQISDRFIQDINDVLDMGQVVTVKVINIDESGKIGLSLKDAPQASDEASGEKEEEQARPVARESVDRSSKREEIKSNSFDDLMSSFLKDSEEKLSSIRKNTDAKRGGRGSRRR